jgi:hypothetical protein
LARRPAAFGAPLTAERISLPVSDNHIDLAVGSIAFAPSNPNIVYAGMGDKVASAYFGSGVLKSTDAGTNLDAREQQHFARARYNYEN